MDQTVLPSYIGSLPNLNDLLGFCYDDDSLFQALSSVYGPEYSTVIYTLFSELFGNSAVSLTSLQNPMAQFPGLPAASKVYQCQYTYAIEQTFASLKQSQQSYYLLVPMPLHMWFEAVATGNLWTSVTRTLQITGATDIASVLQYCCVEEPWLWPFSAFSAASVCVLGAFEVCGNARSISSTAYWISSGNPTILRYLIVMPYQPPPPPPEPQPTEPEVVHEKPLDRHVEEKLEQLQKAFSGSGSSQSNKRIINEYKSLHASKGIQGVRVEFEGGSNMYVWLIYVDIRHFDLPVDLKRDFEKYKKTCKRAAEIAFESRFDANYPQTPPFLRVVSPRFAFHTGHITIGGSICTESLTRQGWTPTRTLESVLIEVISNMVVGNARLDIRQMGYDYTLAEAQEAFHRVARQHGWQ
jgi:ubiquitin-protein ligase